MNNDVKRYNHAPSQYARMFIDTLPSGSYVRAEAYDALEAERERLRSMQLDSNLRHVALDSANKGLQEEIHVLAAELQALKAPCSEVPEVVASLNAERPLGNAGQYVLTIESQAWLRECRRTGGEFDLMTVSQYERIVAALKAQMAGQEAPEGWQIELGFDVLDRPFRFADSMSHVPTIKLVFPACEADDSSAWNLRDDVARRISTVLSDPPAAQDAGGLESAVQRAIWTIQDTRTWHGMQYGEPHMHPGKQNEVLNLLSEALAAHRQAQQQSQP